MVDYVPDSGDLVWIDFEPQVGREITKTRPSLIISGLKYNAKTKLVLCMPITSKIKGSPFEVSIDTGKVSGAILCDQMHSFDWKARNAKFIDAISKNDFLEVMAKFMAVLPNLKNTK